MRTTGLHGGVTTAPAGTRCWVIQGDKVRGDLRSTRRTVSEPCQMEVESRVTHLGVPMHTEEHGGGGKCLRRCDLVCVEVACDAERQASQSSEQVRRQVRLCGHDQHVDGRDDRDPAKPAVHK